jgi:hypothetical protein
MNVATDGKNQTEAEVQGPPKIIGGDVHHAKNDRRRRSTNICTLYITFLTVDLSESAD